MRSPHVVAALAGALLLLQPGTVSAQDARPDAPPPAAPVADGAAEGDSLRLGLDEAVRRATRVNEDVLVARAEQARAEGLVTEVRSDALPQVTANVGYTRNIQSPVLFLSQGDQVQQISIGNDNEYSFGLSLRQTVFDFSLGPARTAARLSREATGAQVEAARTEVALRTREAYYAVLLGRELVRVQEMALEQARRRLEQVEDFRRAGTASEFDLLTAQVEVENLRPDLIQARNQQELARNRLKRTAGIPLERPVAFTDSFPRPSEDPASEASYVERAVDARPDLRGQRVRVELQEENLTAQERDALPTLDLVAGLTRQASSDDLLPPEQDFVQTATAGLSFSLPLFDGRRRAGQVQQAEAALNREEFRLRQLRENIRLEVQQAHQEMMAARERIDALTTTVRRAERALEIAQTRFRNGLSTQVELNDAELAVTRARTNQARARHDYAVARARLMAAAGER